MNGVIFEYFVPVSLGVIVGSLLILFGGMLIYPRGNRWIDSFSSLGIYISIVGLGMSDDIKHLSILGLLHAATALTIAGLSIRHYKKGIAWLFMVPCCLILVVIVFNLYNQDIGLELTGRWMRTP